MNPQLARTRNSRTVGKIKSKLKIIVTFINIRGQLGSLSEQF